VLQVGVGSRVARAVGTAAAALTLAACSTAATASPPSLPPSGGPPLVAVPTAVAGSSLDDPVPSPPAAVSTEAVAPSPVAPPAPSVPAPPVPEPSDASATPAPVWLGTRALGPAGGGPVAPQQTPPELLDRRIVTADVLPPPPDDVFAARVAEVPADVLARSTWQPGCPVAAGELRYVTVAFWGFDGRPHTGEVLVHADAVDVVVAVFESMHDERFPLEEVRIITPADLTAAPTGDGNVTSVFVCRPAVGSSRWSAHAYGRALDVNPFHNPYERGSGADRVVLPELATAYTDRSRWLPGMLEDGSAAVRVARESGWVWGGDYRSVRDWMHLSADGT
jgi:hypothetical protein